jgi:hypothetical protein
MKAACRECGRLFRQVYYHTSDHRKSKTPLCDACYEDMSRRNLRKLLDLTEVRAVSVSGKPWPT